MTLSLQLSAPQEVREELLKELPVLKVIAAGDTKVSVTLDGENEIDVDFRLVELHQYASALNHFTGSKDHNIKMRQIAKERGKKISEYGVELEDGSIEHFNSEAEFYAYFDLPFIPPSVREDGSEFSKIGPIAITRNAGRYKRRFPYAFHLVGWCPFYRRNGGS